MGPRQLDRIAAMRFDTVAIAPPFAAGRAGDLFLTADHERFDERLGGAEARGQLARLRRNVASRQLVPMLDVVIDRVATEHAAMGLGRWYRADSSDELPDPRRRRNSRASLDLSIDGDWSARSIGGRQQIASGSMPALPIFAVSARIWCQRNSGGS